MVQFQQKFGRYGSTSRKEVGMRIIKITTSDDVTNMPVWRIWAALEALAAVGYVGVAPDLCTLPPPSQWDLMKDLCVGDDRPYILGLSIERTDEPYERIKTLDWWPKIYGKPGDWHFHTRGWAFGTIGSARVPGDPTIYGVAVQPFFEQ